MKGLVIEYPEKGTELYIYNPHNLNTATYQYSIVNFIPTDYHKIRIMSGLCYYDLESVLKRITQERERLSVWQAGIE